MVLILRYLEVSVESAGRCDNRVCVTRGVDTGVENICEGSKSHSAQNQCFVCHRNKIMEHLLAKLAISHQ